MFSPPQEVSLFGKGLNLTELLSISLGTMYDFALIFKTTDLQISIGILEGYFSCLKITLTLKRRKMNI